MTLGVKVEGLRELRAALARAERSTPHAVDAALKESADVVVKYAKLRVPLGPPPGGHVRSSLRSAKVGRGREVRGGGARYPYYEWLEFGGHVGRKHRTYRTRVKGGRYIYPAFKATGSRRHRLVKRHIDRMLRRSNLNVRGL